MFGISLTELLIVIFFAIILIKPSEYPGLFKFIKNLHKDLKKAYKSALQEFDKIKAETGLIEEGEKLKNDIENIDAEISKVIGDDGNEYDAYDIKKIMKSHGKKN